jgi:hypothetical protein
MSAQLRHEAQAHKPLLAVGACNNQQGRVLTVLPHPVDLTTELFDTADRAAISMMMLPGVHHHGTAIFTPCATILPPTASVASACGRSSVRSRCAMIFLAGLRTGGRHGAQFKLLLLCQQN